MSLAIATLALFVSAAALGLTLAAAQEFHSARSSARPEVPALKVETFLRGEEHRLNVRAWSEVRT